MIFQKPTEDVYLRFKLKKQRIESKFLDDFYYDKLYDLYIQKTINFTNGKSDVISKEEKQKITYNTNESEMKNMLGIDLTLQSLDTLIGAINNQEGNHNTEILEQKYDRLEEFYNHYIDIIFKLCHLLYYKSWKQSKDPKKIDIDKSGKNFQYCLKTALDLTYDMRYKYEKIFEDEYNALPVINKYMSALKKAV